MRGSSPLPRTRRVTREPSACQAVAISTATTPPPTTMSLPGRGLGAGGLAAGPRLDLVESGHVRQQGAGAGADRHGMPGREDAPDAVGARDRHLAGAVEAAVASVEVGGDAVEPLDLAVVLPAGGLVVAVGEHRGGVEGPWTRWPRPGTRRASARAMTGRSRALLGMHAQYEHSPPTSSFSTIAVERPAARVRSATFSPRARPRAPRRRTRWIPFPSWGQSAGWCALWPHG